MKKTMWVFLLVTVCSVISFSLSAQSQTADKIELSRLGGTTRLASADNNSYGKLSTSPVVEAVNAQDVISISVQNYRGGAWVEIIGPREARQSYIEVYDMGFGVVNLSNLRAGQYTIRITLGSEVYTGTFRKGAYGR
ncbi:hypothetical protein SAMN05216331_1158 [Porphyromonadaceae bacterium KH3R12]|jgi:hypothetical protein|nr:hypothetical protein SAMN05216331_1158 [Porphyromonadaceae bacterium KH3R12]